MAPGTRQKKLEIVFVGNARDALRAMDSVDRKSGRMGQGVRRAGLLGAAAIAGIGVAAGAAAVGLFKLGEDFDKAYDTIRVGTGATGDALEGLKGSFRNVVTSVPTDFGSASTAIADLNTRLGLTGPGLEEVAAQTLELSRLTGTDLEGNVAAVSRVFGDWSVSSEDMPETLDQIYRASQSTGAGVDALATQVVQFGSPLRQMGFSLTESLAIFGKFEKEGVNIETVMAGMKMGLANLAKAGEEPSEGFARLQREITDAGSIGEANILAIETFGQRAGPDMAAAIREGRFELADLVSEIEDGSDTIAQAGEDTQSFGEKWTLIKNRIFVALEPLATKVFAAVGDAMDKLGPIVGDLGEWLGERLPAWAEKAEKVFRENLLPVFEAVAAWVSEHWPEIAAFVTDAMEQIWAIVSDVVDLISAAWDAWGDNLMGHVERIWPAIRDVISGVLDVIQGIIKTVTSLIKGDWSEVWEGIRQIFSGVWAAIGGTIRIALSQIQLWLSIAWEAIRTVTLATWLAIWGAIRTVWDAITRTVGGAVGRVRDVVVGVWRTIRNVTQTLWDGIRWAIGTALNGIQTGLRTAKTAFERVWNGIKRIFRAPIAAVLNVVVNPFLGLLRSIAGVVGLDHRIPDDVHLGSFHEGGLVPGPRNEEGPATLLGGEGVLSHKGMDALGMAAFDALNRGKQAQLTDSVLGIGGPREAVGGLVSGVGGLISGTVGAVGKIPGWISQVRGWIDELAGIGGSTVLGQSIRGLPKSILEGAVDWIQSTIRDLLSFIPGIGGSGVNIGNLAPGVAAGQIVAIGRAMQAAGYSIYGHPAFGGPTPGVHSPTSYHYRNRAIDVNADGAPGGEPRALDALHSWIIANVSPITELLWRTAGHYDHLHLAMGAGGFGTIHTPTRMLLGENGPEQFAVSPLSRGGLSGGGGGPSTIVLENRGVIGSEAELERWLVSALERARKKGLVGVGSR